MKIRLIAVLLLVVVLPVVAFDGGVSDADVDEQLDRLLDCFGGSSDGACSESDLNGDGVVGAEDVRLFLRSLRSVDIMNSPKVLRRLMAAGLVRPRRTPSPSGGGGIHASLMTSVPFGTVQPMQELVDDPPPFSDAPHIPAISAGWWDEDHDEALSFNWPPNHLESSSSSWTPPDHEYLTSHSWPPNHTSFTSHTWGDHDMAVSQIWPPEHDKTSSRNDEYDIHEGGISSSWTPDHAGITSQMDWPPSHHLDPSQSWHDPPADHDISVSLDWPPGHYFAVSFTWPCFDTCLPVNIDDWPPNHKFVVSYEECVQNNPDPIADGSSGSGFTIGTPSDSTSTTDD